MTVSRRALLTVLAGFVVFAAFGSPGRSQSAAPVKLAMKGYDPVAYFTGGQPSHGSPAFSYVWDGSRYLFASAAHRDLFVADPSKYAPQYSGMCTASMARGLKLEGNPENWAIADGRLFLFAGRPGPATLGNLPSLVANANRNWRKLGSPSSN